MCADLLHLLGALLASRTLHSWVCELMSLRSEKAVYFPNQTGQDFGHMQKAVLGMN